MKHRPEGFFHWWNFVRFQLLLHIWRLKVTIRGIRMRRITRVHNVQYRWVIQSTKSTKRREIGGELNDFISRWWFPSYFEGQVTFFSFFKVSFLLFFFPFLFVRGCQSTLRRWLVYCTSLVHTAMCVMDTQICSPSPDLYAYHWYYALHRASCSQSVQACNNRDKCISHIVILSAMVSTLNIISLYLIPRATTTLYL